MMAKKPVSDLGAAGDGEEGECQVEEVECVRSLSVRTEALGLISESLPTALCYFLDSDLGKGLRPLPLLGVSGSGRWRSC